MKSLSPHSNIGMLLAMTALPPLIWEFAKVVDCIIMIEAMKFMQAPRLI